MGDFVDWYNHDHRHTGIGLHAPADVHRGHATDKASQRAAPLAAARSVHPERFGTTGPPRSWHSRKPPGSTNPKPKTKPPNTHRTHSA